MYAVVCGCRLNVHRPARVDVACVYIQRKDEVLLGRATIGRDHCVQKECTRTEVDNGRASDAEGIKFGAYEIVCGYRIAHVSPPDDATVAGIERIYVIRFRRHNDHRFAAGPALDVKRLGVNVATNCTVEGQVARQFRGSAWGERGINVKAVPRIVIVKLSHVHLCVRWSSYARQPNNGYEEK